jgi:hypothetical protein
VKDSSLKIFISHVILYIFISEGFRAYIACIKKSSISNCPLTSFRFVMLMEIIYRKIFGFSSLLNSFVINVHTLKL